MNIEVFEVSSSDKQLFQNLMQFYEYEFSIYEDDDVDVSGKFEIEDVDDYFQLNEYRPLLVCVEDRPAGFVIVKSNIDSKIDHFSIEEFFIMKKYQRNGAGQKVANKVFDMFGQFWIVRVIKENKIGQSFWNKTIKKYSNGDFSMKVINDETWDGPVYTFNKFREI